jgi:hypothetical protein
MGGKCGTQRGGGGIEMLVGFSWKTSKKETTWKT